MGHLYHGYVSHNQRVDKWAYLTWHLSTLWWTQCYLLSTSTWMRFPWWIKRASIYDLWPLGHAQPASFFDKSQGIHGIPSPQLNHQLNLHRINMEVSWNMDTPNHRFFPLITTHFGWFWGTIILGNPHLPSPSFSTWHPPAGAHRDRPQRRESFQRAWGSEPESCSAALTCWESLGVADVFPFFPRFHSKIAGTWIWYSYPTFKWLAIDMYWLIALSRCSSPPICDQPSPGRLSQ